MRSAADEALATAAKTYAAGDGLYVEIAARFDRAISLFKLAKHAEARELFTAAEAKMRPWPAAVRPAGSQTIFGAAKKNGGFGPRMSHGKD
jgi:hypothetical protein